MILCTRNTSRSRKPLYKTHRVRLRTNLCYKLVLCYKRQGNYVVCNELLSGPVGWVVTRGTVGFESFVVRIGKVLLSFFFLFPSFCAQFLFGA